MLRSLVGSEMCIRDSARPVGHEPIQGAIALSTVTLTINVVAHTVVALCLCLLYTSDAADDLLCVDLGGRRIIKKKKKQHHQRTQQQ